MPQRGTRPHKKPPKPGSFGAAIRQLREERGMSQTTLGKITGMGQNNISRIETGEVMRPQDTTVRLLAEGLNVKPFEILERTTYPELQWLTQDLRAHASRLGPHEQDILAALAETMGKSKNTDAVAKLNPERVTTWFEAALDMQRAP